MLEAAAATHRAMSLMGSRCLTWWSTVARTHDWIAEPARPAGDHRGDWNGADGILRDTDETPPPVWLSRSEDFSEMAS